MAWLAIGITTPIYEVKKGYSTMWLKALLIIAKGIDSINVRRTLRVVRI